MSVSEKSPAIAQAWGVIKTLSEDEEARLIAESREKARRDFEDRFDGAYRDGMQEGEQRGKLEEKIATVHNGLRKKIPLETISALTGLSIPEIERIASESQRTI